MKATITAREAIVRPSAKPPANATPRQLAKWQLHVQVYTSDQLDKRQRQISEATGRDVEAAKAYVEPFTSDTKALDAAERGDLKPIFHRRPGLAKWIAPIKKGKRGQYERRKENGVNLTARWAAKCIRADIWPDKKKWGHGLTVEDIVVGWFNQDVPSYAHVHTSEISWRNPGTHKRGARSKRKHSRHKLGAK